jgi:hypothetical protein
MPPNKIPPHGLYIRYGKFEAAAHGRWAVIGLVVLLAFCAGVALRWIGLL